MDADGDHTGAVLTHHWGSAPQGALKLLGAAEQRGCPHFTLPRAEFPAPDPKGLWRPETGGWVSPAAAKLFCLLSGVICFSAVSADCICHRF